MDLGRASVSLQAYPPWRVVCLVVSGLPCLLSPFPCFVEVIAYPARGNVKKGDGPEGPPRFCQNRLNCAPPQIRARGSGPLPRPSSARALRHQASGPTGWASQGSVKLHVSV